MALSVEDLCNIIKECLPIGTPVPSSSWVRLNFWSCNPYTKSAMTYTGCFRVKFAVQQRLTRAQHDDASYTSVLFKYMKQFAVKYCEDTYFFCMEDKAIVSVGEPNLPVSTGVRWHHGAMRSTLSALDHDFHIFGVVPSVTFQIQNPSDVNDSFYGGVFNISLKDKVFQPTSPIRHEDDFLWLVRNVSEDEEDKLSDDGVNLNRPILMIYSDGGPDHRTTYRSVQVVWVAVFLALDLDMLVAGRTAPHQSYANPAERVMSLINLGLQNVALNRDEASPDVESKVKSRSSMKAKLSAFWQNSNLM